MIATITPSHITTTGYVTAHFLKFIFAGALIVLSRKYAFAFHFSSPLDFADCH
jgi:hypothetical protein